LDPKRSDVQRHLVRLLLRTGQATEAEAALCQAIEASPNTAMLYHGLSLLLGQRGEVEAALDAGRRAVALEPGDSTFRAQLGRLLARAERLGEAEDAFGEALALAPDDVGIRDAFERVRTRRAALPVQEAPPVRAPLARQERRTRRSGSHSGREIA
jgi:Flp pilus assembly protein TadD